MRQFETRCFWATHFELMAGLVLAVEGNAQELPAPVQPGAWSNANAWSETAAPIGEASGLSIVDPAHSPILRIETSVYQALSVAENGHYANVADDSTHGTISVLDIDAPRTVVAVNRDMPSTAPRGSAFASDTRRYIGVDRDGTAGADGLLVYDFTNPRNPDLLSYDSPLNEIAGVVAGGRRVY